MTSPLPTLITPCNEVTVADKKSALVGCAEGPWVCIAGMRNPVVRFSGVETVSVQYSDTVGMDLLLNPGDHTIHECAYIRLRVVSGNPEKALCYVLTGKLAATVEA